MDQPSNFFMDNLLLLLVLSGALSQFYFLFMRKRTLEFPLPEFKFYPVIGFLLFARELNNSKLIPPRSRFFEKINGMSKLFEKEGFFVTAIPFRRFLFVYKADIAKLLLNHPAAQEKAGEYSVFKRITGEGLFTLDSQKAHFHRKLITPAFHLGILKDYLAVFNEQSISLISKLKQQAHKEWIDVDSYVRESTSRVICQTALGVHVDKNEELKEFSKAIDEALGIVTHRIIRPWTKCEFIYKYFPKGKKLNESMKIAHQFIKKITMESKECLLAKDRSSTNKMKEKENYEGIYTQRKSFIKLLLESHLNNSSFTLMDLRDEVLSFIAAGAETLTVSLNVVLMMLGLYQDVQDATLEEIDSIFQDDSHRFVTYEDIKEMTYLDCVIKESLRLYPTAPFFGKEIKEDIQLGEYKISKSTGLIFNLYMLHRDPEYFSNPEHFDPTRFYPQNSHNRHPYAYMPFSAGFRNCIGQKFAATQMKVIISHVLRNFRIQSLDHRDRLNFSYQISLKNTSPIRLKLIPRYT